MGRERIEFKREFKGDVVININDIFRNPDEQNFVIKECTKLTKPKKIKLSQNFNNKESIINLIENRIKSEYQKHKNIDWEIIAAHKIYDELFNNQ